MRELSKTKIQLDSIAEELNKGNSVFVAGLKCEKEYVNRLHRDYNIIVEAIPHYITPSLSNQFHFNNNKVTKYLPTLTGYEFLKEQQQLKVNYGK